MSYAVMLVDNEPAIPRGLMRLIDWGAHGCRVCAVASDGADAIRQIRQTRPDIVISDIRMPELDGMGLCKWIRENCGEIQIILLTGFPDFEYAQQAIQYEVVDFVLKPTTEEALATAVDKACRRLRKDDGIQKSLLLEQQLLLAELIFQNRHSLLYTLNKLNELHIVLRNYYVLSLEVMASERQEEAPALLGQAQEILLECLKECTVYLVSKSDACCYAVVSLEEGAGDPAAQCASAVDRVDQTTDFVLTVGLSRRHRSPLQLWEAAREADDAQKFARYNSQPSLMRCEDLPRLSEDTANVLLEEVRLVESALENRSRDAAVKNLDELFRMMRREKVPFSSAYQICLLLHNFCIGLLLSHNLSSGSLMDLSFPGSETMEALEQALRESLLDTLARISRTPGNIDSIIYEVKQYIDQNYSASLTLDALAAMVHLSPSYFSKLFKREMGENLSTYILTTRMEHAKFLLRTTDKKAYEIAEAVGIYDPVYFSKIFKKVTGLKPKEYRDRPDET